MTGQDQVRVAVAALASSSSDPSAASRTSPTSTEGAWSSDLTPATTAS